MIARESLEEMFERRRSDPNATWSIDDICLWGYFFTDHSEDRLAAAAPALEKLGYRVVGLLRPTPQDDDQELLFLQVERNERHTVESLHLRNIELCRFAEEHGLESYDGMDVGPVGGICA